jgi:hypothetical protein
MVLVASKWRDEVILAIHNRSTVREAYWDSGALCLYDIWRLAEFSGLGMSFNICRGTLGSLAMFTAKRNASSRVSSFAVDRRPGSFSK